MKIASADRNVFRRSYIHTAHAYIQKKLTLKSPKLHAESPTESPHCFSVFFPIVNKNKKMTNSKSL